MKRRLERISAGLLAALALCLCPCFAGAAPQEEAPAVKTFWYAASGMSAEQSRHYQIGETARGRFAWIELRYSDHYVLPLTDEDMASFCALLQELELAEWDGFHRRFSAGRADDAFRRRLCRLCSDEQRGSDGRSGEKLFGRE